jgi:quinoprotein dehydrogenase-associated probable ABC transporter substrate-binding protein
MRTSRRVSFGISAALTLVAFAAPACAQGEGLKADNAFRVCADPNNLPFSNQAGEGFENKLAELIAGTLGEKVTYDWHAQRRGFVRETLKAKQCDVVMGFPKKADMLATTKPYYRSTYVFVTRADRHLDISSIKDPRLHSLKIGVQVIGNDGANTPPSHALAKQGIIDNVVGYTVYGDYSNPNPPARIVEAVENGDVDIAAVWGPLAGYFAKRSPVPLTVTPITETESFTPLIFQYDIALGVRKGDHALKSKLDDILVQKRPEIAALLQSYGIPTLPLPVQASENRSPGEQAK